MANGIEWVVTLVMEDGTRVRGVQTAMYGNPAIEFFAKNKGLKYKAGSAEKMFHFENFLAKGLRQPLTEEELS
jgi:hypothetical protein